MNRPFPPRRSRSRAGQRGIALAVVLVIMTIMTLLGVMLLMTTDANQLMARNERDVAICRQAAEAATRQGISLAGGWYDPATHLYKTTLLGCTGAYGDACPPAGTPPGAPAGVTYLSDKYIIDYPGKPLPNWLNSSYVAAPGRSPVFVTIYARNNIDGSASNPTTPDVDKDGHVVIVGEAEMTDDNQPPNLPSRSNVRVRKMIAAEIYQSQAGKSGCGNTSHNQGSNYGC